jgi:hypothetical protein
MNATVTITGLQLSASNLPLPNVSTWFAWYYERNLDYSADANVICSDIVATSQIDSIEAIGNGLYALNGIEISSEFGSVSSTGDGTGQTSSVQIESQIAEITASESLNAQVSLDGVQLAVQFGSVLANVLNPDILKSSAVIRRYSADTFKSARIAVSGITVKIESSNLNALGVISVNGSVSLQNVGLYSQAQTITSEGVLSISEEELVTFLMAA